MPVRSSSSQVLEPVVQWYLLPFEFGRSAQNAQLHTIGCLLYQDHWQVEVLCEWPGSEIRLATGRFCSNGRPEGLTPADPLVSEFLVIVLLDARGLSNFWPGFRVASRRPRRHDLCGCAVLAGAPRKSLRHGPGNSSESLYQNRQGNLLDYVLKLCFCQTYASYSFEGGSFCKYLVYWIFAVSVLPCCTHAYHTHLIPPPPPAS